ncbi:MAG: putative ABC transporter permease [Spirochaetaceae bacterium]|jgi:uncharacterized membrane protein|nr:putative ABC transporter permease [Spirochaetaceae bacterium]
MEYSSAAVFLFEMFVLSFTGWVLETAQESIVRKKFVSKGFFQGPYVPLHGIGGVCVYLLCSPLKAYPAAVFFIGMAICTAVEYLVAVFLEKCFKVKCWDYRTYPHTRRCHFQGRICLTLSLFFGLIALFVVYFYWDFVANTARHLGTYLWLIDGVLALGFIADAVYSCGKVLKAKKAGTKIKGWAVFSDENNVE